MYFKFHDSERVQIHLLSYRDFEFTNLFHRRKIIININIVKSFIIFRKCFILK